MTTFKKITGSDGITRTWANKGIPFYNNETWERSACKVENGVIVLDPSRQGTTMRETKRWEVYCNGEYICTKRLVTGGGMTSAETVALPYPKPTWIK